MEPILSTILTGALVALAIAAGLVLKAVKDFTQAGPQVAGIVRRHYRWYTVYAVVRLAAWAWAILWLMATLGALVGEGVARRLGVADPTWLQALLAVATVAVLTAYQFCFQLLENPGGIVASSQYRLSRVYPLWERLTRRRLARARVLIGAALGLGLIHLEFVLVAAGELAAAEAALGLVALIVTLWLVSTHCPEPAIAPRAAPGRQPGSEPERMNLLMIGCDTLRADRAGADGPGSLTPCIGRLGRRGALFENCFVPLARTAPSLASYLTGMWPHGHGIRENFVPDEHTALAVEALPEILGRHGFATAAVGDWAGSDLGKFRFGFATADVPPDQWNLKYLIRQGPKDLRLFLVLFTSNRFGRLVLPELYYLAGVPLTRQIGRRARRRLRELARGPEPFFLDVFIAAAHPPFASEYPYYCMFTERGYRGRSKFAMSNLADPAEVVRSQGQSKEAFDLEQILGLYDGCVRSFDDEVARILAYVEALGIAGETIVVIYSDHGMEFFEHDTWGQGNSVVGDASTRVPLVVVDPRRGPRGRIREVTRTVDLAPTVLDLLGLPVPAPMQGVSLRGLIDEGTLGTELLAFAETGTWINAPRSLRPEHLGYPDLLDLLEVRDPATGTLSIKREYEDVIVEARDRMVRSGDWLLVYFPQREGAEFRLFDVRTDPECRHDRRAAEPAVYRELEAALVAWLEEDPGRYWDGAHLKARPAAPAEAGAPRGRRARADVLGGAAPDPSAAPRRAEKGG